MTETVTIPKEKYESMLSWIRRATLLLQSSRSINGTNFMEAREYQAPCPVTHCSRAQAPEHIPFESKNPNRAVQERINAVSAVRESCSQTSEGRSLLK